MPLAGIHVYAPISGHQHHPRVHGETWPVWRISLDFRRVVCQDRRQKSHGLHLQEVTEWDIGVFLLQRKTRSRSSEVLVKISTICTYAHTTQTTDTTSTYQNKHMFTKATKQSWIGLRLSSTLFICIKQLCLSWNTGSLFCVRRSQARVDFMRTLQLLIKRACRMWSTGRLVVFTGAHRMQGI